MISEGSCDTEDLSIDAEILYSTYSEVQLYITAIHYI